MALELVESFPVGPLGCNFSLVGDLAAGEAILVDPGDEPDRVLAALERSGLKAIALVHTHAHLDHVGVSALLARVTGAPLHLHQADEPLYQALPQQAALFGFDIEAPGTVHRFLEHGGEVRCGSGSLEILHTPGHTPGSVCFRLPGDRPVLFSGDTLFRRSIGRTDLWGGSFPQIVRSIRERLFSLPGDLQVVPGHGESTTIAEEARKNPFVGEAAAKLV